MGPLLCITFSCGIGLRYVALWAELLNEVSQKKKFHITQFVLVPINYDDQCEFVVLGNSELKKRRLAFR